MAIINRLSANRKTTRTQVGGYDIEKWNDADLNEDAILLEELAVASDLNTAKVGITTQQASDITANNAKVTYPSSASDKLATIESSAKDDQTGAEIKALYEIIANAFTDIKNTKLEGIAENAEVNISPRHIVYATETAMLDNQSPQIGGFFYYVTSSELYYELKSTETKTASLDDYRGGGSFDETISIPVSDFVTDVDVDTNIAYVLIPWNCTAVDISGHYLASSPTGSSAIIDVHKSGVSIMTTDKIVVEDGESSSLTATTKPTLTTTSLTKGDVLTVDVDQKGSTNAGKGLELLLTVLRS